MLVINMNYSPHRKTTIKIRRSIVKLSQPYLNTEYLTFKIDVAGSIYKNLRKTINHRFDRKKII